MHVPSDTVVYSSRLGMSIAEDNCTSANSATAIFSNSTDHHTKLLSTPEAQKESCSALLELEASGMMQLIPVEERNFTFKRSQRSHSLPKNGTKKTANPDNLLFPWTLVSVW
ncbi:hypothetical protein CEXT_252031 [Caerostris extrusa]|uniref:Uncharacterized protein n=1 Tax=Caerostris extrusa TaxID=172846 RepID=A0AAV4TMJ0_CAEEX|nr:hypothetical protein CEXT_252031 [Caerostris extrusa]